MQEQVVAAAANRCELARHVKLRRSSLPATIPKRVLPSSRPASTGESVRKSSSTSRSPSIEPRTCGPASTTTTSCPRSRNSLERARPRPPGPRAKRTTSDAARQPAREHPRASLGGEHDRASLESRVGAGRPSRCRSTPRAPARAAAPAARATRPTRPRGPGKSTRQSRARPARPEACPSRSAPRRPLRAGAPSRTGRRRSRPRSAGWRARPLGSRPRRRASRRSSPRPPGPQSRTTPGTALGALGKLPARAAALLVQSLEL